MKNPIAILFLDNQKKIEIELFPEIAPNTVNSFVYAARKHIFDGHFIERIVPEDWIDVSYTGFMKKEGQYLIPYESDLHPEIEPLDSHFGCVCMGGYGARGQAGCEFFFPLRDCPEHKGIYPVFGHVTEGLEELERLKSLELEPILDYPDPRIKVNKPLIPQQIRRVEIKGNGWEFKEPIMIQTADIPACWRQVWK